MDRLLRLLNTLLGVAASLLAILVIAWPNLFPPATRALEGVIGAILAIQNQTISYLVIGGLALIGFIIVWTLFASLGRMLRGTIHEYKPDDYWFNSSYRSDVEGSKRRAATGGLAMAILVAVTIGFLAVDPGLSREAFGWQSEPATVLAIVAAIVMVVFVASVLRRN